MLAGWSKYVVIKIKASQVSGSQTDFPVYVDLSTLPADFHASVNQTDGRDIRVTLSDGVTEVPREVVFYNAATDKGVLYFKGNISSSADTYFHIYYGNPTASEPAKASTYGAGNVWTNYRVVYHMAQNPGGTAPQILDSTNNNKHGTTSGSMTVGQLIDAPMGKAIVFDGTNDRVLVPQPSVQTASTVEAWLRPDLAATRTAIEFGVDGDGTGGWGLIINNNATDYLGATLTETPIQQLNLAGGTVSTGVWDHLALKWEPNTSTLYENGVVVNSGTTTGAHLRNSGAYSSLGSALVYPSTPSSFFNGAISEFRISSVARSTSFLSTQYANTNSPATFYDVIPTSMTTVNFGKDTIGATVFAQGQGRFEGISMTPTKRGRVVSYNWYLGDVDTDDVLRMVFSKTVALQASQIEVYPTETNLTISSPIWYSKASTLRPIVEAGETYILTMGITPNSGVGNAIINFYYDNFPSGNTYDFNYLRNTGITTLAPYLEPITRRQWSAYVQIQPVFDNNYAYRKEISTDPNQIAGSSPFTDFPILISLTDADLKSVNYGGKVENINGYDIRFEDLYGAKLDHEIEKYNPITGELVAHVRIPTLDATQNTNIYLYYGNPDKTSTEANPTGVWASDYRSVFHMNSNTTEVKYTDVFNDPLTAANGTALQTYQPTRYSKVSGSNDTTINNNRIQPGGGFPSYYNIIQANTSQDQYLQATFLRTTNNQHAYLALRSNNSADFRQSSYALYWEWGGSGNPWISLIKWSAGVATELTRIAYTYGIEYKLNTEYTARVEVKGATLTGYVNGTQILSYTDATPLSGLYGGFDFIANGTDPNYMENIVWGAVTYPVLDSTSFNVDLTNGGATQIAGKIDGSYDFESSEFDTMSIASTNVGGGVTSLTLQGWIKPETLKENNYIMTKTDAGISVLCFGLRVGNSPTNTSAIEGWLSIDGVTPIYVSTPNGVVTNGVWQHIAMVYQANQPLRLYRNGVEVSTYAVQGTGPVSLISSPQTLYVGTIPGFWTDGVLDELRISHAARSANYLLTEYNNENSPSTFYTVGVETKPTDIVLSNWSWHRKLTVDAAQVEGATTLTNFQAFYEATVPEYRSIANGGKVYYDNGKDITFGGSADPLNPDTYYFQIAEYNPVTGYLAAYVNIPSVSPTTNTDFWIHYGNPTSINTREFVSASEIGWGGTTYHGYRTPVTVTPKVNKSETFTSTTSQTLSTYNSLWVLGGGVQSYVWGNHNIYRGNGDGFSRYFYNSPTGWNDHQVEMTVTSPSAFNAATFEAYTRASSAGYDNLYLYNVSIPAGSNPTATFGIYRVQGGTPTLLQSTTLVVNSSTSHIFKVVTTGTRHRLYWDNTVLINTFDSNIGSGQYAGFGGSSPAGLTYTNTSDTWAIDNVVLSSVPGFAYMEDTKLNYGHVGGYSLETEVPIVAPGKINKAYQMTASQMIRGLAPFENNSNVFTTVHAWVYRAPGNEGMIYSKTTGSPNEFQTISLTNTNLMKMTINNSGSTMTGTTPIPTNTWTHCAWVLGAGGVWKFYINGVLDKTESGKTTSWSSGTDRAPMIGSSFSNAPTQQFNGYIDEYHHEPGYERPAEFLRTLYNNGMTPGTFIITGNEQGGGGGGGWVIFGDEGLIA